jgi:hypothetical protein
MTCIPGLVMPNCFCIARDASVIPVVEFDIVGIEAGPAVNIIGGAMVVFIPAKDGGNRVCCAAKGTVGLEKFACTAVFGMLLICFGAAYRPGFWALTIILGDIWEEITRIPSALLDTRRVTTLKYACPPTDVDAWNCNLSNIASPSTIGNRSGALVSFLVRDGPT